jgi:hypothetical protein
VTPAYEYYLIADSNPVRAKVDRSRVASVEEPDSRRPGELRRNMHLANVIMRDELDVAKITREEFEERCRTKWTQRNREKKERHLRKIWSLPPDGDVGGFPHIQALYDLRKEIAGARWWVAVDRRDPYPEWHIGDRDGEPPLAHRACPNLAWLDDALTAGRATQPSDRRTFRRAGSRSRGARSSEWRHGTCRDGVVISGISTALAGHVSSAQFCSGVVKTWRARQDSNLWPLPSEGAGRYASD